jgi:hypothetical protein
VQLIAAVVPGRAEARVEGVAPGQFVMLAGGLQRGDTPLPGGLSLGIVPTQALGGSAADADGHVFFAAAHPPGAAAGLEFFLQAFAIDLATGGTAIAVSEVVRLTVPSPGDGADVFVLFGQSNAEGHAPSSDLPASLRGPLPRCRIWSPKTHSFEPLTAGVNNRTFSPLEWCGPELSLARALSDGGRVVHVVKFAIAQTALGPSPGPWNEWNAEAGELYSLLLLWITQACTRLRRDRLQPQVRGICMMQGESDATDESWAAGYLARLGRLVDTLRTDLVDNALAAAENVPFVIGLINSELPGSFFPWVGTVRSAQQQVAADRLRCATVDSSGLPLLADRVHLSTAGVIDLGNRFAAALAGDGAAAGLT